ncbi:Tat pathway signal sequence domain protein, partial [Dickeya dianthicola]|nr:Tat pathway signal sequence domain protein [Dickeya dianthicola]
TIAPPSAATGGAIVTETAQHWVVDTGRLRCQVPKNGERLIDELRQDGWLALGNARLVLQIQSGEGTDGPLTVQAFQGQATHVTLEQNGPQRAVIALRGVHRHAAADGVTRLPFVVRLYFYAGSASLRLLHTIIYDGDERQTFIKGLGVAFDAPQQGELHDRHIRFTSAQGGLFREAVRGLTGLRRDPGAVSY